MKGELCWEQPGPFASLQPGTVGWGRQRSCESISANSTVISLLLPIAAVTLQVCMNQSAPGTPCSPGCWDSQGDTLAPTQKASIWWRDLFPDWQETERPAISGNPWCGCIIAPGRSSLNSQKLWVLLLLKNDYFGTLKDLSGLFSNLLEIQTTPLCL